DVQKEFERSASKVKDRSKMTPRKDNRVTTIAIYGVEEKKELVDYIVEHAQV
ncbi:MAG: hypothetical protein HUJ70_05050, partial [Pseudobutyrivibrio sp.]|nr:hypothetical protein [Pseudobutyrivibrio sp.]